MGVVGDAVGSGLPDDGNSAGNQSRGLVIPSGRIIRDSEPGGSGADEAHSLAWDLYRQPVPSNEAESVIGRWEFTTSAAGNEADAALGAWIGVAGGAELREFAVGDWRVLLTDQRLYANMWRGQVADDQWRFGDHVATSWLLTDIDAIQGAKKRLLWTASKSSTRRVEVDIAVPAYFTAGIAKAWKGTDRHGHHKYRAKNSLQEFASVLVSATATAQLSSLDPRRRQIAQQVQSSPPPICTTRHFEAVQFDPDAPVLDQPKIGDLLRTAGRRVLSDITWGAIPDA